MKKKQISERLIFLHSTPVLPSLNGSPNAQDGLQRTWPGAATHFSESEEKAMLFQIAYPNLSIVPLIPASVQIQSTLSQEQKKEAQERLTALVTIFKDYQPIRDTFAGMAFMLQNPHLMELFLNASPSHNNGLPLANSNASIQLQTLQILRQFEAFVGAFSMSALLQSMGEVPSSTTSQGLAQLEKLYKILGHNPAYAFLLQGVTFGLKLQQSNPPQAKTSNPIRDVAGVILSAKGGMIKTFGSAADIFFENVKDANDTVQKYAALLKNIPILSSAVEPAKKYANTILDGMHMVIADTAEAVGDALQSAGSQPLRRQSTLSFANNANLGLDDMLKL